MEQQYFATRVRLLRKEKELSQEQMAAALGVSVQAVSKWECAQSYPDLGTLIALADYFGVSVDALLRPGCEERTDIHPVNNDMPNDGTLYIVQVRNGEILREDQYDPDCPISLCTEEKSISISVWGNAQIEGAVGGSVNAGGYVESASIGGRVDAGGYVACGHVGGYVNSGQYVECGNVSGYVNAGQYIECGNVGGGVSAGQFVQCGNVTGNVTGDVNVRGDFSCGDINGDVTVDGTLNCGDIRGDVNMSNS